MFKHLFSSAAIPLFLCATMLLSGCGEDGASDFVSEMNKDRIQRAMNSYRLYQSRIHKAPKSRDELVEFIKTSDKIDKNLEMMGISRETYEEELISERDGEEYIFRWGTFINDRGAAEPIVFEAVGVDGARQVMWTDNKIEEYDEKEYEKLLKGKFRREKFSGPDLDEEAVVEGGAE